MSDLIDRQAAIEALERIFDRCEEIDKHLPDGDPDKSGYRMYDDYMIVWKFLKAQPERKTGKWILVNDRNGQHYICEFCGEWKYHQKQKFCGECGAHMMEVQDA